MAGSRHHKQIGRYKEIANALARHGLGYVVGILGLQRFVPFHKGLLSHPRRPAPYTRPEHVRMALEDLGAASIKLGQIVSTRADLLSPEYLTEFAKLQDAAPAVPFESIEQTLVKEFGRPLDELFATFERTPLASASIGQAYAATLDDGTEGTEGTEVVVKVRRPGVMEQIEQDLDILQNLAAVASRRWAPAEQYDLVGLAEEFAQTLRAELDYPREGHSAERFARNFAGDPSIHIPAIYWELTTPHVLTMERIRGIKISDLAAIDAAGIDRKKLAERSARIILKMVFEDGFFHADPHPGNFFIEPGGRIGLIDFGMVGTVDEHTQEQLAGLLLAITGQRTEQAVDMFLELGVARAGVDRQALLRDLQQMLSRYYDQPLGEIPIGPLLRDTMTAVRRHRLQLPPNLALLIKALLMNEGLGAQLDPSFNMTTVLAPYAEDLLRQQYSPLLWARRFGRAGLDMANLSADLPRLLRRISGEVERGTLQFGMRPEGFEPIMQRLERLVNRIVLGIIAGAFIIGLGMLMAVYHPPGWEQWAGAVFAFGFLVAAALGIYLAWSILRSRGG